MLECRECQDESEECLVESTRLQHAFTLEPHAFNTPHTRPTHTLLLVVCPLPLAYTSQTRFRRCQRSVHSVKKLSDSSPHSFHTLSSSIPHSTSSSPHAFNTLQRSRLGYKYRTQLHTLLTPQTLSILSLSQFVFAALEAYPHHLEFFFLIFDQVSGMDPRQARRMSAKALARNFQRWRKSHTPVEEQEHAEEQEQVAVPMEYEFTPDSTTYAQAQGSSQKGRKSRLSTHTRAGETRRVTRVTREGQDQMEAIPHLRDEETEEDEPPLIRKPRRMSTHARAGGSGQATTVSDKKLTQVKREGKAPIKPSMHQGGEETEEDEPKLIRQPRKKNTKPSATKYLEALLERNFEGTRYPHKETMQALGIARDMEYLFEAGGIRQFMNQPLEAYKEETCHFLSSLRVHFYDEEPDVEPDDGPGFITFACRGQCYALTIAQICNLYGFSGGDELIQDFDHEELQQLWSTIGDSTKPFSSSRSKSSSIRSPVLRYLHKTIASSMFARKVTGTVNEGELRMLDLCLLPLLGSTRDGRKMRGDRADANLALVLMEQFLNYKDWAIKMGKMKMDGAGDLCIGGIITPILVACDVELRSVPYPPKWIDIDFLRRCRFLDHTTPPDEYIYQFMHPTAGEAKLRLPCTDLTKVRQGRNIDFHPPLDRLYNQDEEIMEQGMGSDDQDAVLEEVNPTERYSFEEYKLKPTHSPALKEAHKRINLLQRWNKFQGKTVAALKGTVKDLKDQVKDVKDQLKDFTLKFKSPTPKKTIVPGRILTGSGSFREEPRHHAPEMEPPRASSFEPRQPRQFQHARKRRQAGGASGSRTRLEQGRRDRHFGASGSRTQLDHYQVESTYSP